VSPTPSVSSDSATTVYTSVTSLRDSIWEVTEEHRSVWGNGIPQEREVDKRREVCEGGG
jgi:hypothetical protein